MKLIKVNSTITLVEIMKELDLTAFVQKLADFFAMNYPELKGFNRRGLYRIKQFYELYKDNEKVSTLLTQLNWSNHLKIMSACDINKVEMSVLCLSFA